MILHSVYSVAVGNAIEDIKAIADCTWDINDHDGVAKWLAKYILT